jgi:hypothetical protein
VQKVLRSQTKDLCWRSKVLFSTLEVLGGRKKALFSQTKDLLLGRKAHRFEPEELFFEWERLSREAAARSRSPSSPLPS